jgi:hypothetical protein
MVALVLVMQPEMPQMRTNLTNAGRQRSGCDCFFVAPFDLCGIGNCVSGSQDRSGSSPSMLGKGGDADGYRALFEHLPATADSHAQDTTLHPFSPTP